LDIIDAPLLAIISLLIFDKDGSRGLPSTFVEIYEEFVEYLLNGRQEVIRAWHVLRESFTSAGSDGECLADWLYGNRRQICAQIAHAWLDEDDRPFLDVADTWIRENAPVFPFY
jgi:hypothetical protein